jgi:hypothetical protein
MPSTPPDVAVIVLNWNNAPDTLECLASVYRSKDVSYSVYVADNGSSDGSLETIRAAFPQALYIENKANLGFAEGNNRAIAAAMEDGVPYIFLLNNDAVIHESALAQLKECADKHPQAAVLGPKVYFYNDPSTIWYGGGDWDPARASVYHHDWGVEDHEATKRVVEPTGYVCGCTFFARSTLLKTIGLMDPLFFLNWEEIDWCWRMKKAGYQCLYVPEAKAWHKISCSFEGGKKGALWLYFYWRNRLLWMERHLDRKEFFSLLREIVWPQIARLIRDSFSKDPKPARAALRGIFHYLRRRFGPPPSFLVKR